ncbi:circularly permuted type 2 ATP-grasp protein [Anthocerotibacter panamensis]|uniref:circularly permuted type 2 ATP-grasp protein n=1 Tax=Anthocerotibacter panamensis TaxID=2857077 RepID=UPI001C405B18|nr:circularly permuted type 2 ATP-grasp protein [Anthocerotibacter panamensis]
MKSVLTPYEVGPHYDEMFTAEGVPREHYQKLVQFLEHLSPEQLSQRVQAAQAAFLERGVTFGVYGSSEGTEKIFPFDIIPRIIAAQEWEQVERGLVQRLLALNLFLKDIYHDQLILKDKVVPEELVYSSTQYRPEFRGLDVPRDVYVHVCGTDLIRHPDGSYRVLEDNLRVPSGVSYVLENRRVMKQVFPAVFENNQVRTVVDYPQRLLQSLRQISSLPDPSVVVLTPGVYNSAYFEHTFLALQMGAELVEGRDLVVENDRVYAKTIEGLRPVDIIYRRMDDDFLDPEVFRKDSTLGIPGLMRAYRKGRVILANAIGTGVADDKVIYTYVPDIIRYYLGEEAVLQNVETFRAEDASHLAYILEHMPELVVKEADNSGGYGMLIGPRATKAELALFREKVLAEPRKYLAQPVVNFSRHPTYYPEDQALFGCHIDLRPYILNNGEDIWVMPGGLTRVALKKGSLVVNSSQGGGSKDTWVLDH